MDRTDLIRRIQNYADRNGLVLGKELGAGIHGTVFSAKCQIEDGRSAIKGHDRQPAYYREHDVYLRLQEHAVTEIRGCAVPELLRFDDELWIVEMTIVTRPFVLDFGGAYLDFPPDFSDEVMMDWQAEKQEQFGTRWREVQAILAALEGYGVYMVDVNPGNISFGD